MDKTMRAEIEQRIAAALDGRSKVRPSAPEDNPLHNQTLADLRGGAGVRKGADNYPAINLGYTTEASIAMETERVAGLADGREALSNRRKTVARARQARQDQWEAIDSNPVVPDQDRMLQAWRVVVPLHDIICDIANSKKAWASRFLGSVMDDVAQMALEKCALMLAKSDHDLEALAVAADELGLSRRETGKVPGDQVLDDDERKARRVIKRNRKWLMGMVNNRVMGALVDTYESRQNLVWENIDMIPTVMATISGVGEDPAVARTKADRAPAFLGTRFARPGGFDGTMLAVALSAAITDRGLDPLTELLLDDSNLRTDGSFAWQEHARQVFLLTPECGPWMWDEVCKATAHLSRPKRARADAARLHVRNLYSWMPGLIVDVVDAFDQYAVANLDGHAVMTSTFEEYLPFGDGKRYPLRPALAYTTAAEAAAVLTEHLAVLITGQDLTDSITYA